MDDPKVVTVTLNPSLDRTLMIHYLAVGYHNRTTGTTRLDPAGRGVNISRALHALGGRTHAVIMLGDDATARAYQALIEKEAFPVTAIRRSGLTRSNIVILDTGTQAETYLIEESVGATPESLQAVADALRGIVRPGDIVVYAGSLPNDAPDETYARLINMARQGGAFAVLDTPGDVAGKALEAAPDLVVLKQNEAEGLFNHPVRTRQDAIYCGRRLLERRIEQVLITVGSDGGAILVTEENIWQADFPELEIGTRSGVKEAMVAGYLAGQLKRRSPAEALKLGAAAAAYTASQVGSNFGSLAEVEELMEQVNVQQVEDESAGVNR